MNEDDSLRRLREELGEMGVDDLPPEVIGEIERARLTGGKVRIPRSALDRSDLNAASRRVSVTRSTVNGQTRTEIRETGSDGVERVYSSMEEAPAELRAWIERAGAGLAPGSPPPGWVDGPGGSPPRPAARVERIRPVEAFTGERPEAGTGFRTFLLALIAAALLAILGVLTWMAVR
jgi:hypothetical protein